MAPTGEPAGTGAEEAAGPKLPQRQAASWRPPAASPASWCPHHQRGLRRHGLPLRPALSASSLAHQRPTVARSVDRGVGIGWRPRRGSKTRRGCPRSTDRSSTRVYSTSPWPDSPRGTFAPLNHPPASPYNSGASAPNTPAGPETGWWVKPPFGGPQPWRPATGGGASSSLQGPLPPGTSQPKSPLPRPPPAPTGSGPWACLLHFLVPYQRRNPP